MKSATIFEAYSDLEFQNGRVWGQLGCDLHRQKALQLKKFREEIARRLDERDTMHATVDRLQRELAEARARVERLRPAADKWMSLPEDVQIDAEVSAAARERP